MKNFYRLHRKKIYRVVGLGMMIGCAIAHPPITVFVIMLIGHALYVSPPKWMD